jgi:acyl-coenzyme A thioesterase PaaI-like protein
LNSRQTIRRRVLRGIALNRQPGLHFPGAFLGIHFDRVDRGGARLSLDSGPWCRETGGETGLAALTVLADLALGASIRARLSPERRLATVSFTLQFTGAPRTGDLRAFGEFQGFFERGAGKLGLSRVSVASSAGQVCYGTGTFMSLQPPGHVKLHPVPFRNRKSREPAPLDDKDLKADEKGILRRADVALAARGAFIENFWGGADALQNGLHVGNRVGHAQGGILIAMAARSAAARLPRGWQLSGITALYVSPGEGRLLRAGSKVVHLGRLTAVVRTEVTGKNRRRVLEVVTTHCASA